MRLAWRMRWRRSLACRFSGCTDWNALAVRKYFRQLFDEELLTAGAVPVSALPQLQSASLAERLIAEDANRFIAKPEWEALPQETSLLTRSQNHPLVEGLKAAEGFGVGARLVACLAELEQIPTQMLS
ncbi:MAG: hypothetical protein ACM3Y9_06540, partial [Ignavibacteria bacterium]